VLCLGKPIEPGADIVAFEEAIGGESTSTRAVGTGVSEEDRVLVIEEQVRRNRSCPRGCRSGRGTE
jgi:hypothetical protein